MPGKKPPQPQGFINRNLVAIVMIPAIIGIHYGWTLLQDNEALVSKEERMDLPTFAAPKRLWKFITGSAESSSSTDSRNK